MAITPEQCARFSALAYKAEMIQIESLMGGDEDDTGLPPQEMALELWESGYLPAPTIDALLDAMEMEMGRRESQKELSYAH